MKTNKLLSIKECYFNLPDNFNGTLGEALSLLAQYRLSQETNHQINQHTIDCDCYTKLINDNGI